MAPDMHVVDGNEHTAGAGSGLTTQFLRVHELLLAGLLSEENSPELDCKTRRTGKLWISMLGRGTVCLPEE